MIKFVKKIFIPAKLELGNGKKVTPPRSFTPYIILLLILVAFVSIKVTDFDVAVILKRGEQFFAILEQMIPPDWSYVGAIIKPLMDTIKMSLLGSFTGSLLAIPFAVLSAQNMNDSKIVLMITRFVLSILRTIPTLIIALIATYIFDIGTLAGTIAIGIFSFAIVAKMLYEQIETVDMSSYEAMESIGASKTQAFITSVIPQITPSYLSICLYTFEINVRYAAILGYVGAGGIGLLLDEKLGWREYDKVGMVIIMLFITVIIIESLSRYFRERLT